MLLEYLSSCHVNNSVFLWIPNDNQSVPTALINSYRIIKQCNVHKTKSK